MIKVIDGKRYNTETADCIATTFYGREPSEYDYYEEDLYRTKKGN